MRKREQLARKCLVEVVKHVLEYQGKPLLPLTYQELAARIGLFNRHGEVHPRLGRTLGIMGHLLEEVDLGPKVEVPELQALVVGKNSGVPDGGMKEFWPGYDRLRIAEKRNMAKAEWLEIEAFGALWNAVLEKLGEDLIPSPKPVAHAERILRYGSGGESPAHKALKAFVMANPALVGVDGTAKATPEYTLPSLDRVDVMFQSPNCWTAVEVKSRVSEGVADDYERGVYQVVKYSAIIQAMRSDRIYVVPQTVRAVLVLECQLPSNIAALAGSLQVEVIDKIKPTPNT